MNRRSGCTKVAPLTLLTSAALTGVVVTSVVAALLVAGPAGAASSTPGGTDPGITRSTLTIGQVDTLTGPVPGLFLGAKNGTQAYVDYVNSQGGVNGRKLKLIADDDQFSSADYADDTEALATQAFAFVGGFSLFDGSGVPTINKYKIPDVALSLSSNLNLDQYNYSPQPLIPGSAILGPLEYFKQKYGSAIKHVGTIDTGVTTAEVQTNAVLSAMRSIGYKIVYHRVAGAVETTFTSDILKMKAAGVQMVVIVGMAVNQVAALAQQMALQGFHPKLFTTNGVAYDSSFVPSASASSANGTDTYISTALYLGKDAKTVPAVALFDKWLKKVSPSGKIDVYAFYGWTSAQLFVQALRAAGPNPTRASVLAQLDKITRFTSSGMQAPSNPAQKRPASCWLLIRVVHGTWQRVAPSPKTGYICKPGGYYYPPGTKPFKRKPPPS